MDKVVVIAGTTASGKSQLAIKLAKQFQGYIINADSRQIYDELIIGTAQPTPDDIIDSQTWLIGGIKHYLFGFLPITEEYNIHKYKMDAAEVMSKNSGTPFLVGGTGLYIDSVIYDYDLKSKSKGTALPHLYLFLDVPKDEIDARIKERIEEMFENGLEKENRQLWEMYHDKNLKPLKSIGYREFPEYFSGRISLEELKHQIFLHTRQYAKRQRTWFRRNKEVKYVKDITEAMNLITDFLNEK